jgi:hypothetical protein
MTEQASDDMLRKIQALLDKADSTDFGPERDAFRAKADDMMLKYSVEQYQLEEVRRARGEAVSLKPITKDIVVPWHKFAQHTYDLLLSMSTVPGVRTLYRGWENGWRVTLIGFEVDVRYVEMLWTALRVQMLDMMEPSVDPDKSFDENVFLLRQAGMNWMMVRDRMNKHVNVEWHPFGYSWNDEEIRTPRDEKERQNKHILSQSGPWPYCCDSKSGTNTRLLTAYRRQCEMHGVDPAVIRSTEGYRNAWAESFRSRIRQRLMEKRGAATETGLVLARKSEEVYATWKDLYNEEHKDDVPEKTSKRRVAKYVEPAWDPQGAARGRAAADRADLSRLEERVSSATNRSLR